MTDPPELEPTPAEPLRIPHVPWLWEEKEYGDPTEPDEDDQPEPERVH